MLFPHATCLCSKGFRTEEVRDQLFQMPPRGEVRWRLRSGHPSSKQVFGYLHKTSFRSVGTEASVMWAERMGCEQEREQRNAVVAEGVYIKGEFLKMT